MTVTPEMRAEMHALNVRFAYNRDPRWNDQWTILRRSNEGDCDDYAVTLAWALSGRSVIRMLRNVARGRAEFSRCETARGEAHMVLRWDGWWIDNIQRRWTADRPHHKHRRQSVAWVVLKLIGTLRLAAALAVVGAVVFTV